MTDKERYATIATWEKVFASEGFRISYANIKTCLKAAGILANGETGRDRLGRLNVSAYYAESDVRDACKAILSLTGRLDAAYFQNLQNLKADLSAFAAQLGPDKTPLDLHTGNISTLSITCQNGERVKGQAYLNRAAVALGFAEIQRDANSTQAKILKRLLRLAGYQPMDKDYFQNLQNLKADLDAFAAQLGPDKSPLGLHTGNIMKLPITCQNGEKVRGRTYLSRAAIDLGFAKNKEESHSMMAKTLRHLLKLAGHNLMDKDYFQNIQTLKADLSAFAAQLGPDKTPLDLTTYNIRNLFIICQNGQEITGLAYLNHAAIALCIAKNSKVARARLEALGALKKMAGYKQIDFAYFQNPQNLEADLFAFAFQLGPHKTPLDLNTFNTPRLSITCQNGQTLRGQAYLNRAAVALGFAKNTTEAKSMLAKTIRSLKEMAGYL